MSHLRLVFLNDSGEMFVFTNATPSEPGYLGWRECDEPVSFAVEPCDEHEPQMLPSR